MTSHMTSKLSVNMSYFRTNLVIIMQLSSVTQGWCFPTYFTKFFLKSFQKNFLGKEICLRSS